MRRTWLGVAVGSIVVVAACGDVGSMLGDAMIAAGDAMSDTGRAHAQDTRVVECGVEATRRVENAETGFLSEQTMWFAQMDPGDVDSITGIDVVLCGRRVFGEDVVTPPCPEGSTCEGVLPSSVARADCVTGGASFEDGALFVPCGSRLVTRNSSSSLTVTTGERRALARVTIRR